MKAVVQRVQKTSLKVDGKLISEIDFGLTVFLLNHMVRSTVEAAMFAQNRMLHFCFAFFKKRMGFGATPHGKTAFSFC